MNLKNRLGFMQGRLVKPEKKKTIQYFPANSWKQELLIAKKNQLSLMEWTVNIENINKNPLINEKLFIQNKKFIKQTKVKIKSVTCDFFMQKPFFKFKYRNLKKKINNYLISLIKKCETLDITFLVIPLVDNSSISSQREEEKIVRYFKKIKKQFKKIKIIFEIDYEPDKVLNFIRKFNSNQFGINYDTGNSSAKGFRLNDELRYFKYVKNIHIKDRLYNGPTVRLGEGEVNFDQFFRKIKKINYKGNFILQTARSKNNKHLYEIKRNLNFIKKFI